MQEPDQNQTVVTARQLFEILFVLTALYRIVKGFPDLLLGLRVFGDTLLKLMNYIKESPQRLGNIMQEIDREAARDKLAAILNANHQVDERYPSEEVDESAPESPALPLRQGALLARQGLLPDSLEQRRNRLRVEQSDKCNNDKDGSKSSPR